MESTSVEYQETDVDAGIMPSASFPVNHSSGPIGSDSGSMTGDIMSLMSPPNSAPVDKRTPNVSVGDKTTYPNHASPLTSLLLDEHVWKDQTSPLPPPVWDYLRDNREWDALLTGEDFDLDAVNLSLLCATSDFPPPEASPDAIPELDRSRLQPPPNLVADSAKQHTNLAQEKWHTFSELCSGQMTPIPPENSLIDDSYRKRLAERLQPRVQHGILPSTPFLDLCIQAYFSKFHPLFPIVHVPTFRPGIQNSILLLSICSAGSLVVGSPRAISHGISMFERLNKAILSSWETYVVKSGSYSLIAMQAVMLGQTFGLLLGRPKDLTGIDVFHGTIVGWARKSKLFNLPRLEQNPINVEGKALEDMWLKWIQLEVKKRIALALTIHNAELATLHHHEPILRSSPERLPCLSSNDLFMASSAHHWKGLMIQAQIQNSSANAPQSPLITTSNRFHNRVPQANPTGDFELCAMLECISALASEEREKEPGIDPTESSQASRCHHLLITWYNNYQPTMAGRPSWACLMMLWHSVFMMLHVDFNSLECVLGREGYDVAQTHLPYARAWVHSADAKRCLLHAMLTQKSFESLPAGAEPAFHVPMCLYYCGLIWACFMSFKGDQNPVTLVAGDNFQFNELSLQGIDGIGPLLEQTGGLQPSKLAMGSLFRIIDLLQRISHWKISQSLASTLLALAEETQDLF
ncbi:uncharacterized protein N7484_006914 [Penicillium longicatenatum]|uniref:uncharacterized protein n=1 Tax=Penicillium longicatenatum TaxID=1561947 RepID=UPI00254760E7|nr:uncharacterized protein N7484_006914 [Penicillium longicatenatum]KAJ5639052.1 hypothetical protein N7484_006914 [Penicillium longicatenatum]